VQIIMVGVGCVGKSAIGKQLGKKRKVDFIDFDEKVQNHFSLSIERIKNKYLSENSFRKAASVVLKEIFTDYAGKDFVLAMPPSGLRDYYWRIIKVQEPIIIEITDDPKNILKRISFFDIDSKPIKKKLSEQEKMLYLREIKLDMTYFKRFNKKANLHIFLDGKSVSESVMLIEKEIALYGRRKSNA